MQLVANGIAEQMDIICSCGTHLGVVDAVIGDRILIAKNDPLSGGEQQSLSILWVNSVDDSVHLIRTAGEVQTIWELDIY